MAPDFETLCQLFLAINLPFLSDSNIFISQDGTGSEKTHEDDGLILPACVKVMDSLSGNLSSPGYPHHLPHHFTECDWVIQGQPGQHMTFTFMAFDLPHADVEGRCSTAHVNFGTYDYLSRRVAEGRMCGSTRPRPFHVMGSRAWVTMVVTGAASRKLYDQHAGISLTYKIADTDIAETHLFLGFVFAVLIPVMCCCPMTWYYRRRKQVKTNVLDVGYLRAESRRQKGAVQGILQKMGILAPKPLAKREVRADKPGADMTGSYNINVECVDVERQSLHNNLDENSKIKVSRTPDGCRHGPCAQTPHETDSCSTEAPLRFTHSLLLMAPHGDSARQPSILTSTPVANCRLPSRHKCSLHKLSVAFSVPSMGSISELEEPRKETDGSKIWDGDVANVTPDVVEDDVFDGQQSSEFL